MLLLRTSVGNTDIWRETQVEELEVPYETSRLITQFTGCSPNKKKKSIAGLYEHVIYRNRSATAPRDSQATFLDMVGI